MEENKRKREDDGEQDGVEDGGQDFKKMLEDCKKELEACKQENNLLKETQRQHDLSATLGGVPGDRKEKSNVITCLYCKDAGKIVIFPTVREVTEHQDTVHALETRYACGSCPMKFHKNYERLAHEKQTHGWKSKKEQTAEALQKAIASGDPEAVKELKATRYYPVKKIRSNQEKKSIQELKDEFQG